MALDAPLRPTPFLRIAPALFVFLWSTGWIVARYSADYADPLAFLSVRYAVAGLLLFGVAVAGGARWPRTPAQFGHAMVAGVLIHAVYLGGVWWAVSHGLAASISALLAALQPILTALLAPALLHETISRRQWLGVGLGLLGLIVVLSPKLATANMGGAVLPVVVNVVGMVSVTLGTFYQKRFIRSGDLRCITVLQYVGAIAVTLPVAALIGDVHITWNLTMAATLAWSVLALSIGAVLVLLTLIRHGAVSRQAQLIYLVPPSAAVEARLLFGETLSLLQWGGMVMTVLGVALATRRPRADG